MEQTAETVRHMDAVRHVAFRVSDVSGQKTVRASAVPDYVTVHEVMQNILATIGLPKNDVEGRPLTYRARLEREGRHLYGHERVGDVLAEDDHLVLHPNIDAGCH